MFILYQKVFHILKEPQTKNRTHQTWRGEQLAACEDEQPLIDWIKKQPTQEQDRYYIEPQADTVCERREAERTTL